MTDQRRQNVSLILSAGQFVAMIGAIITLAILAKGAAAVADHNQDDIHSLQETVTQLAMTTATLVGATEERRANVRRELDEVKLRLVEIEGRMRASQ